jgi:GT2 family glycosyltransferase/glycosyltransferase involved in cell wall biosynthesis
MTPRIVVICPEPIRALQQGVGIRFREMSRELSRHFRVTMWTVNDDIDAAGLESVHVCQFPDRDLARELDDVRAVVLHGHVSDRYFDELARAGISGPPLVCDLYDPFLIENLQYTRDLGTGIYERDRKVLARQLALGDMFLVSSERQRLFYAGMLMGSGGFDASAYQDDPALTRLFVKAPFGVSPAPAPAATAAGWKGVVPGIRPEDLVVMFGGIYDWYDPDLLLDAALMLRGAHPNLRILFSLNPNPETTPQSRLERTRARAKAEGLLDTTVFFVPWFAYRDRAAYLNDVDVTVCLHLPSLETDVSLRTRVLDYMCAGIPVIATAGGDTATMIDAAGAGILVPAGDADALTRALGALLATPAERARLGAAGRAWVSRERNWPRTLAPLVRYCANPVRRSKAPEFSVIIPTHNRRALLGEVITALSAQQHAPPFEVIVVDDGSTDGTREWLASRDGRGFSVITQPNRGPAAARNAGLAIARGRIVAFLGDDTIPAPDWLAAHAAAHRRANNDPRLAVIGRVDWHDRIRVTPFLRHINEHGAQFGFALIDNPQDVPFNFFYTANVSINRNAAGDERFDEEFPDAAWEDIEFAYRLTRNGLRIHYAADARVRHDHPTQVDSFLRRQERAGYAAVIFHERHPELGSFLGLGPEGPPSMETSPITRAHVWGAALLDRLGIPYPGGWDGMLRHGYLQGLHRGWRARRSGAMA